MRRRNLTLGLLVALALCFAAGALAEEKVFGEGVSEEETVLISQLLDDPEEYSGKVVRVAGLAVGVCKHRGCWVSLASDREGETMRIKVQDGVIVFPPEIIGEQVVAEGVFTINQLDMETTKRICKYEAEKAGEDFDPQNVTECMTVYQITGTGAVVEHWGEEAAQEQTSHEGHDHDHDHAH